MRLTVQHRSKSLLSNNCLLLVNRLRNSIIGQNQQDYVGNFIYLQTSCVFPDNSSLFSDLLISDLLPNNVYLYIHPGYQHIYTSDPGYRCSSTIPPTSGKQPNTEILSSSVDLLLLPTCSLQLEVCSYHMCHILSCLKLLRHYPSMNIFECARVCVCVCVCADVRINIDREQFDLVA